MMEGLSHLKTSVARKVARGQLSFYLPWSVVLAQTVVILVLLSAWSEVSRNQAKMCACPVSCNGELKLNSYGQLNKKQLNKILAEEEEEDDTGVLENDLLPTRVSKNPARIFFNRVPKCGSSTLMDLITEMSKVNNFTFARAKEYMRFWIEDNWQRQFASRVRKLPKPVLYERHLHYMDFSKYGMNQPVYINLVRDPLERLVSWYYFRRYQSGHIRTMETSKRVRTYDECVLQNISECVEPLGYHPEEGYFKIIPFFCGQEDYCREPSERSLVQAIRNVKRSFAVIGIMEEYPKFIMALQHALPKYFRGATKVYKILQEEWMGRHRTTYKLPISTEVSRIMQDKLKQEYQFYYFVRQRFYRLISSIETSKLKREEQGLR